MARTRSESAHQRVLDAALELVADRGVDGASMDAIAARSGVSKATIYKHWADKDALLLELMAELHGLHTRPTFDTGKTKADMVDVLAYRPPENTPMRDRIMPQFLAYSATNVSFGLAWRNMVMEPPRRELSRLMKLGMEKGELAAGLDTDLSLALLLGPVLYWKFFPPAPIARDPRVLAKAVTGAFWKAFGAKR